MAETPCSPKAPVLLSPWRRRCQWGATLLLLLTPWFHIGGDSALRIDIPSLSLHFFGQTLRIEELYLVLLFSLTLTLGFLLITMVLGRIWCGWLCPQTTLTDLAEWFATRLGLQGKKNTQEKGLAQKVVLQLIYLSLAFLVSANLLWYFIEPLDFFSKLLAGQLHYASWISLLLVTLVIYLDLALIRRLMCKDFCPYGRFQTVLADQSTLTLHLPNAELERCIEAKMPVLKLLPNCLNINYEDDRYLPFWRRMAEVGMVLLSHTGGELTVKVYDASFGDPKKLAKILEIIIWEFFNRISRKQPLQSRVDSPQLPFT